MQNEMKHFRRASTNDNILNEGGLKLLIKEK